MEIIIQSMDFKEKGKIKLDDKVFGLEVRQDIIKRVMDWQLMKRMSGTSCTKTVSDISGTTKKPHRQKGTGRARQGSLRSVQMRGGAVSHGPVQRDMSTAIQKKVRKLGLKHALSYKLGSGKIIIVDNLDSGSSKTKDLMSKLNKLGGRSYMAVDADNSNVNFKKAASNIHYVSYIPQIGVNVYDLIKHDFVLITSSAVKDIEKRLAV